MTVFLAILAGISDEFYDSKAIDVVFAILTGTIVWYWEYRDAQEKNVLLGVFTRTFTLLCSPLGFLLYVIQTRRGGFWKPFLGFLGFFVVFCLVGFVIGCIFSLFSKISQHSTGSYFPP